jgi:epoxide hydrolase-like predicted phosphatase
VRFAWIADVLDDWPEDESQGIMRAMPVDAVVFDIGGVLEVNPPTSWQERWTTRLHLSPVDFEQILADIWGPGATGAATLDEIECRTAAALGLDDASLIELMNDAWTEYVGTLNREVADYFVSLRPRYKTGILSNSFVGAREREQCAYGFEDMCDVIVYSHELGYLKPQRESYEAICACLGVAPEQTILLDDTQANVDGARAVGMKAVTFNDTRQALADLQALLS